MRMVIAVVGRPRNPGLAAAITEYEERAARYWPLEVVEVREVSARGASPEQVREREGERLRDRMTGIATVVVCEEEGSRMTSQVFAKWLEGLRERGRDVAFAIGGAFGLSPALRSLAAHRLALAPWTLPHEVARLVLAEQLYRAGSILRREPYHK